MSMRQVYYSIFIIIASFVFTLNFAVNAYAIGTLPLGARCRESHECGLNMGCRPSELGDFSVCKITVPTTPGCAIDAPENMCGDGLVCEENRCKSTFGLPEDATKFGQGTVPLGGVCKRSRDCGINMGCRQKDTSEGEICKITVPGTKGCAVSFGENMCADGMVCVENECKYTYGADGFSQDDFRVFQAPNFAATGEYATLSTLKKILSALLAIAFIVGITYVLKGLLVYQNATGFMPQEHTGMALTGVGSAIVVASILLWLLLVV